MAAGAAVLALVISRKKSLERKSSQSCRIVRPKVHYYCCCVDTLLWGRPQMTLTLEEALVNYNMHFKRYCSFGVMVQPKRQMNHDTYIR